MFKNKVISILGALYLLLGAFTIFVSFSGITGLVIAENLGRGFKGYLGIIFFIMGIMILTSRKENESGLERGIRVYDASNSKSKDHCRYYTVQYSNGNRMTLDDLNKQINEFRRDNNGDELVELLREELSPELIELYKSSNSEEKKIAHAFLIALGEKIEEKKEQYRLNSEEKREIQLAFNGWTGSFTKKQREVLDKYNLYTEKGKGSHPVIIGYTGTGYNMHFTSTPGDSSRGGKNMATDICHLIERGKNDSVEKRKIID